MTRRRVVAIAIFASIAVAGLTQATPRGRLWAGLARTNIASRIGGGLGDLTKAEKRLALRLKTIPDAEDVSIVIEKGTRRADVLVDGIVLTSYEVSLGGTPVGAKTREGDGKTPEGTYRICTRLDRSRFHRFMGLSYPGPVDAENGLSAGAISSAERDSITANNPLTGPPLWNTQLGGAVGLHGGGTGLDWTLGCIAFENDAIEELWLLTMTGTEVTIRP